MIRRLITALALSAALSACAGASGGPAPDAVPRLDEIGPMYVTLLGNYSGHEARIEVDGRVLVEGLMNMPPYGAEDRYFVANGPGRTAPARVWIAMCPTVWEGEVRLEPMRSAYLLFDDCSIEALAPD